MLEPLAANTVGKETLREGDWFFEVLPCHPRPYPGECLSGYLLRLAEANGFPRFWDLAPDLFPVHRTPGRLSRWGWEYPVAEWGRIPLRAQLSPAELTRLTVVPWLEKFRRAPAVTTSGHLSPGHFLRGMVHPHLAVCPLCLRTEPYIRLSWRLAPLRVCLEHGCLLQTKCQKCKAPLTVLRPWQRHLRCAECDADLSRQSVRKAAPSVLAAQARIQADLLFLLDPHVTLVRLPPSPRSEQNASLSKAIGLKFRYLREQDGLSVTEMGECLGVQGTSIAQFENAVCPSIPFALAYLAALNCSWSAFAALELPGEFVERMQEIPFLPLRVCPTPECPNHVAPPSMRVKVSADIPARRIVRFRCESCGSTFTRAYDGALVTKPRRPVLQPGEPPTVPKSEVEIGQLTALGLQGKANRTIARRLGWSERTVRMYWIALGLEAQVHQAQAAQRDQEQQQRQAALRERVRDALNTLLPQDEEITLRRIGRALGHNPDYLQTCRGLLDYIQSVLQPHNAQVKQRRHAALLARVTCVAEELKQYDRAVSLNEFAQLAGLSADHVYVSDPEVYAVLRDIVREHRARIKQARVVDWCTRLREAAARLGAQGTPLTYADLCRQAGLQEHWIYREPTSWALLQQLVGDSLHV